MKIIERDVRPAKGDIAAQVARKLIGQPEAINGIIPYVKMHQAGLAPEGRPAGVFLLLGPSGSGKTRTVEVIAEALHGSEKNVLRIDCGEFQMEHEVAKLIGAPPGYLGHRETHPMLSQAKLNGVTSEKSNLAIVLFDEVEKAASSLSRLLLGVLDKASLRLGDNTTVNFEKTLIFLTSNLGAREMLTHLKPAFGFNPGSRAEASEIERKLGSIGDGRRSPALRARIRQPDRFDPDLRAALAGVARHDSRPSNEPTRAPHSKAPRRERLRTSAIKGRSWVC